MTSNIKLKEAFEVDSKYGAFYTGGNVEWHRNTLYCQTLSSVSLLDVENGSVTRTIGEENSEEADQIHTFTSDGERLITSHKSGLLKLWNARGEVERAWKSIHKGPVVRLRSSGNLLASGGADGVVRLWNLQHQACVSSLKQCQGVVNVVEFHHQTLFGSGDDGKINSWDVTTGTPLVLYNAHYSKVTCLVFARDDFFVTSGRDKVIVLWQVGQAAPLRVIPVYEAIEVVVALPRKFKLPDYKPDRNNVHVGVAGENGVVRIWDVSSSKEVYKQNKDGEVLAITGLLFDEESKSLAVVTVDQNIILCHLKSFACVKQFVGFSDEILDLTFVGKNDSHLAVATNSCDIKLYNSSMSCQLVKGHTDIVLALCTNRLNPDLMLSAGKDNRVRLWSFDGITLNYMGVGLTHTGSVGCVAFSNSDFFVSGSQDTCLKLWQTPKQVSEDAILHCLKTETAHQKDINCVAVAPNDKIIATASQDKTVKLWTDSLTYVGSLKGHKRGVWCVKFSPVDQVVVTSSADCTVKLWSVAELNCLKTFQGHDSSVLQVAFVSNGMQILSAGADGVLKVFSVKTSECVGSFEQHEGKIWAMAVKSDETGLVTGGSDSLLVKWKDVTEERKVQRTQEEEEQTLQQQQLANYLQNDELLKALKLALKLDRPLQVLKIVQGVIKKGETGGLAEVVKNLTNEQKENLLKCATSWNTNSRNCQVAQLVLNILINELQTGEFRPVALRSTLEGALPYTERHFKRLTQLLQDLHFVTYTINCMQPHIRNV